MRSISIRCIPGRAVSVSVLAVILAFLFLATGQQANAGGHVQPEWATWRFDVDFYAGKIISSWTITVGGQDEFGNDKILISETEPILCEAAGDVTISGGIAYFSGGAIKCVFPDFAVRVDELIEQKLGPGLELGLGPTCECLKSLPADVKIKAFPTADGGNPLFYHPSIQFSTPTDVGAAANSMTVDRQSSAGAYKSVTGFTYFASDYECSFTGCTFTHMQNGLPAGSQQLPPTNPWYKTGATTVYLGYDPNTGDTFTGQATVFSVDPGCRMD